MTEAGDAFTWVDVASLGLVCFQAVVAAVSVVFAFLTVRQSRDARREDAERFRELRESERTAESEKRIRPRARLHDRGPVRRRPARPATRAALAF